MRGPGRLLTLIQEADKMTKALSLRTFQALAVAFAAASAMLVLDEVAAHLAAVPLTLVRSDTLAERASVAALEAFPGRRHRDSGRLSHHLRRHRRLRSHRDDVLFSLSGCLPP